MVILVGGKFLSTLKELMESELGTLSSYATNCGLGINSNKTDLLDKVQLIASLSIAAVRKCRLAAVDTIIMSSSVQRVVPYVREKQRPVGHFRVLNVAFPEGR